MCKKFVQSSNIMGFSNNPQGIPLYICQGNRGQGYTNGGFPPIHNNHHHNKLWNQLYLHARL
jgi:hypothetical protein